MIEQDPNDILFTTQYRISSYEFEHDAARAEAIGLRNLHDEMANYISHKKVKTDRDDFSITKRLELYVATPEEFWSIVKREAETIALRYGRVL